VNQTDAADVSPGMDTINGLPLHPLVVHAVVVLLPLTALCVILHAVWPTAARRLGVVTPILGLICVVLVPIATHSGDELSKEFGSPLPPLIAHHEHLADRMLPWTIALALAAIAVYAARRWPRGGRALLIGVAGLAVVAAVGTAVTVAQVGEAGARAVWGSST
jgi:hypothetical protein